MTPDFNRDRQEIVFFIYSHVHTLFGSFLHPVPLPHPSPLPRSVPGRSRSALITDFGFIFFFSEKKIPLSETLLKENSSCG
jgi:hypothetical protein